MSAGLEVILERVRKGLGRGPLSDAQRASLDARMADPPRHLQPGFDTDPVERFAQKLAVGAGTFDRVRDAQQAFDALAAHLDEHGLDRRLVAAPALREWPWPSAWQVEFRATRGDDLTAVTPCFAAVAETGSVVLLSGPDSPTTLNFLPDYHIVLVQARQLVRHIEDVWSRLREHGEIPRTVNFITGPSKTADVEQTLQLGAHGPRSLHIIYVDQ